METGGNEDAAFDYERTVAEALDSIPPKLRDAISNVEIVIEEEPPPGEPLLGLYQGIPLTRRANGYAGTLPDRITLFRGPLERAYGSHPGRLRAAVTHVVLHEVAHHFGISDERLVELGRY
jgi:predicted Zn-dependent protease with MMP-like domain